MIFSHLPIAYPASDLLASFVDQLSSLKAAASPASPPVEKLTFPFFFPLFQEADQVLAELHRARICDADGNPYAKFNFAEIPLLPFRAPEAQTSLQALDDFLGKPRQLDSTRFQEQEKWHQLKIPVNFLHFLNYLIAVSQHPYLNGQSPKEVTTLPIQDIQLIGSYVLELLKEPPFRFAAQYFFGSMIENTRIEQWFQMEHVKRSFSKQSNDYDFRFLSPGALDYQAYLSQMGLHYLASSICDFDVSFFTQQLKQRHPKYQNANGQNVDPLLVQTSCLLEFGGLTKRKLVDLPKTQYAILGVKTIDDKPTDLLFVGLKDRKPTLETLNLSTTNCWTISMFNMLTNRQNNEWVLKIGCQPFSATKALIDLLCGISTVPVPNVEAWRRFIRECVRSMQPQVERNMVDNVFKFKTEFLQAKQLAKSKKSSEVFAIAQVSDAKYIYYLLKEEILKSQTQNLDPQSITPFLFRACQSLQTHSRFSDQDCVALWKLMNDKGWLHAPSSPTNDQSFILGIKRAIIDEQVPFSVVSAWIGLLTWVWAPRTATSHCHRPVFHLRTPMHCLLPIQPLENGKIVQAYLMTHSCPSSFHCLYQTMALCQGTLQAPSPLIPYFSELGIDLRALKGLTEAWLTHDSPLLNTLGFHLYLGCSTLAPDPWMLALTFQRLPQLLQNMAHPPHAQEALTHLNHLTALASPGYQQALIALSHQKSFALKRHQWISILCETHDRELLLLAYTLWKESETCSPPFVRQHATLGWTLYRSLCTRHPHLALALLQILHPLPSRPHQQDEVDIITQLLRAYQAHAPRQFICDIAASLPLMYPLFEREKPLEFSNSQQKQAFAHALAFFIETLYQAPYMTTTGDYFLLEASRRGYLDKKWQTQAWFTRLEILLQQPAQAALALALFQILDQENLFDRLLLSSSRHQQLQIMVGEALLLDHQNALSLALLNQLAKEEIENAVTVPFYLWVLHLFQEQAQQPLEKFPVQVLDILLLATPPHRRFDSQAELHRFFQRVVTTLNSMTDDLTPAKKLPLAHFDQFLGKREIIPLLNQADEDWKELLLDYLEVSLRFTPENRISTLWDIYEQVLRLFNRTNTKHMLRLFKLLALLFEHTASTSHSINPKILEWTKNQHAKILGKFRQSASVKEIRSFMLTLDRYHLPHENLAPYIWWVCQEELRNHQILGSALPLLDLDSFENIYGQIGPADRPMMPKVLAGILVHSPTRPLQALPWMNACLDLQASENPFSQSQLTENGLTCVTQLIDSKEFNLAFELLIRFSSLSDDQLQQAKSLWIQIASILSSSSSVEVSRKLILNKEIPAICQEAHAQLRPFVSPIIRRHLSESPLHPSAKTLAVDLLETYAVTEADVWCDFWKALDSHQDKKLVEQGWDIFKKHSSSLGGALSAMADCWLLAFDHLQRTEHSDLITYFNQRDWLKTFSDPSTSHQKWRALESLFLGTIHVLTPSSFDAELFDRILAWKSDLASLPPGADPSEVTRVARWNQTIEFALIEHLKRSSNPVCLLAVARLLCPQMTAAQERETLTPCVEHFGTFVVSYLALLGVSDPTTDQSSLQNLTEITTQTVDAICQNDSVSSSSCLPLVAAFLQQPTDPHLKLVHQLMDKIFNQGKTKDIEALKPSFLAFIPLMLDSQNATRFIVVQRHIERSFALMGLSLLEKSQVSYLFFQQMWADRFKDKSLDDINVEEMMAFFAQWAPHLFAQPSFLRDSLFEITHFIIPYASSVLEDRLDQKKFTRCLTQLLDVKYAVKLPGAPANQESLQTYHAGVIKSVRHLQPKSSFLVKGLATYGNELIDRAASKKLSTQEVILFLYEFVRVYPPQPLLWAEEQTPTGVRKGWKISPHQNTSQKLLRKAYQQKIFDSQPDALLFLEIWLAYPLSNTKFGKRHRPLFEMAIQQFLTFDTSYSISRAIRVCGLMQTLATYPNETKSLFSWYQKLLQAMRPHMKCVVQNDENSREPLFGFLYKQTLQDASSYGGISHRDLAEIADLFFQTALSFAKELQNKQDKEDALFQAYYLSWCFRLLHVRCVNGAFENQLPAYFNIVKEMFPLVKSVEFQRTYTPTEDVQLATHQTKNLCHEWVETLLNGNHLTKNLRPIPVKANEKRKQREILFESLHALCQWGMDNPSSQLYDRLVIMLVAILDRKKPNSFYWMHITQPDAMELFELMKRTLDRCPADPRQRLAFELLHHQFKMEGDEHNYESYFKHVEYVIRLIPTLTMQDGFPFVQFSQSLLNIVLNAPTGQTDEYLVQRENIVLRLFSTMVPIFEAAPPHALADAQQLLLKMLEASVDENLLYSTHPFAVERFEWAKQWLQASPYPPCLHLLNLTFYQEYLWKQNSSDYIHKITNLMPSLCQHVVLYNHFHYSERMVWLITTLPITKTDQFAIFTQWLNSFSNVDTPSNEHVFSHLQELLQRVKEQRVFETIQVQLHSAPMSISSYSKNGKVTTAVVTSMIQQTFNQKSLPQAVRV